MTNGAFDITIYPLMVEWGFTTGKYKVPSENTLKGLLKNVGSDGISFDEKTGKLELNEGVSIDLGAIAKGYTSSRVMEIFKEYDVECAIISLGGNVHTYNKKYDGTMWKVEIENPDKNDEEYAGIIEVADEAVITSGGYERNFEEDGVVYHHIFDPATGYPAKSGLSSVSIVSKDGTMADALSTALFVMGKDEALEFWKNYGDGKEDDMSAFDLILIDDDGRITITPGIKERFSSDRDFEVYK